MEEHFLSKLHTIPEEACWHLEYQPNSYGYIRIATARNGKEYAHRIAYELFVGPIPRGMVVDHTCRVRCCVNPDHLQLVTLAENTRLGTARKREDLARGL